MKNEDKKRIEETLLKISNHPYFERSPRNIRLLKYLVEKAIEGSDVKENTIGIEQFSETFDPNNNDGKVRVYMYNLRNKLKEYYKNNPEHSGVKFIIKKGQYNLTFDFNEEKNNTKESNYYKILSLVLGCSLIALIAYFVSIKNYIGNFYCWNNFFASESKNLCIVADHYMVLESLKAQNKTPRAIRVKGVNNDSDFYEFINSSENKGKTFYRGNFSLISKMAPFSVKDLSSFFYKNNADFDIKLETQVHYDDIVDYDNIVYIGQSKSMNESRNIFLNDSKKIVAYKDGFKITKDGITKNYMPDFPDKSIMEYCVVSFTKLKNGINALFIVSNHDIGVMGMLKKFTDRDWVEKFYKENNFNKNSQYNVVFKVLALDRDKMSDYKIVEIERMN